MYYSWYCHIIMIKFNIWTKKRYLICINTKSCQLYYPKKMKLRWGIHKCIPLLCGYGTCLSLEQRMQGVLVKASFSFCWKTVWLHIGFIGLLITVRFLGLIPDSYMYIIHVYDILHCMYLMWNTHKHFINIQKEFIIIWVLVINKPSFNKQTLQIK